MIKRIIDKRKKEKFMLDDEYLNGMAKLCGWQATIVYNSLCRHANKDQTCFPSINLMAEQHGVSRPTILKGLAELEKRKVIEIETTKTKSGTQANNVYTLLDKSGWDYIIGEKNKRGQHLKSNQVNKIDSDNRVNKNTPPSKQEYTDRVNKIDCKETHVEGNTYKETHYSELSSQNEVNQVMDVFYKSVNPTINFGNKTSRKAVDSMLKIWGLTNTLRIAEYACSIQGQQYAPVVTTPHQLKEKIAQLKIYKEKQENNSSKIRSL